MKYSRASKRPTPIFRSLWVSTFFLCIIPLGMTPQIAFADTPASVDETYPLDDVSREVSPHGRVQCPRVPMVRYAGDIIRYRRPIRIYEGFRDRLKKFEAVVRDVAIEVYGRAPRQIVHMGTYNCRRIRGFPNLVSEHGMGNAIDVAGFNFPRLSRNSQAPDDLPRRLRRGFKVRLLDHWNSTTKVGKLHARFLRTLARRLLDGEEIFRVLLGPSYPGHKNHFHFDCAPYRMVDIF